MTGRGTCSRKREFRFGSFLLARYAIGALRRREHVWRVVGEPCTAGETQALVGKVGKAGRAGRAGKECQIYLSADDMSTGMCVSWREWADGTLAAPQAPPLRTQGAGGLLSGPRCARRRCSGLQTPSHPARDMLTRALDLSWSPSRALYSTNPPSEHSNRTINHQCRGDSK
jgi:hypothetical protein